MQLRDMFLYPLTHCTVPETLGTAPIAGGRNYLKAGLASSSFFLISESILILALNVYCRTNVNDFQEIGEIPISLSIQSLQPNNS